MEKSITLHVGLATRCCWRAWTDRAISPRCGFRRGRRAAVRDLVRAREDGVRECRNARHRLKACCCATASLRGKSSWTGAHLRWLATLKAGARRAADRVSMKYCTRSPRPRSHPAARTADA